MALNYLFYRNYITNFCDIFRSDADKAKKTAGFGGGIVGYSTGQTTACYNTGLISGGGVIGQISGAGSVTSCHWKNGTSPAGVGTGGSLPLTHAFTSYFTPTTHTEWGTGNGQTPGTYWKPNTINGQDGQSSLTTLPRLWWE